MKNLIFLVTMSVMALLCGEALAQSTWNPSDKTSGVTLSNGNLSASVTNVATRDGVRGTLSHASGKYYFEVTYTLQIPVSTAFIGIDNSLTNLSLLIFGSGDSNGASYNSANGHLRANANIVNIAGSPYTTGDVVSFAVDVSNHLIYWAKNGTWQNSANPGLGTGGVDYITTLPVFPAVQFNAGSTATVTLNTGATTFAYSIPSGFSAWSGAVASSPFIFTPTVIP